VNPALRKLGDRLEQLFKTDLGYLLKGGSWLALGQVVASASVFVLAIAFANLLPREIYGTYKYVQSVAGILAIFGMSGINTYIAQAVARGKEATFVSGMKARMRWGLLGGAAGLLVAVYYFFAGNTLLSEAFLIAAFITPFVDALGLYNVYLQGRRMFREAIVYFSIVQIVSSAVVLVTILFTDNLFLLVAAYFLPLALLRGYFHLRTLAKFPPNTEDDPQAISYGAHLSVINVLGQAANYIDTIIIFHALGAIPVALYSFALAPIAQITALYQKNLPPLAIPKLANRSMASIDRMLWRRLLLLAVFGVAIVAAYIIIAPYVFHLVFPKYVDAIHLSEALSLLLLIGLPSAYLSAATQAKINAIPPSWLYLAAIPDALHIIALIAFIPFYGIYGVVIARAIDAIASFCVNYAQWRYIRALPEPNA
jgi:O-antigen/teichoic acid export membrane protein